MDNNIILIGLGAIDVGMTVTVLYQQRITRQLRSVANLATSAISGQGAALGALNTRITAAEDAVCQLQEHVGVITPDQLKRMAAVDRIRSEYRSLGLAVDADELDENQLRELESALLSLKVVPVRRETDDEVNSDLQALFDNAHPDSTGPLPHASDHTDESPLPTVEQFPETPADPSVPWSSGSN